MKRKVTLSKSDRDRAKRYAKRYGITLQQYDKMMKRQDGKCALCYRPPRTVRLAVDHCHRTLRVRGLLCFHCNRRVLGRGRERPEVHARAAEYLKSKFDGRKI